MPDRSNMIPMKVKNGIASKVSFDNTPHSRLGMVLSKGQLRLMASE